MDIYRPRNYEGKLPVMFNLHGGGFLLGKKKMRWTKNFRMLLVQLFLKWRKVNVQIRRWWNFFLNTDEMLGNFTGVRIRIILPAQGCNRYIQLRTQFS